MGMKKGKKRRKEAKEEKKGRKRREKGRKGEKKGRKGKEGKGEYEDSVGDCVGRFFFKVQRSVKNSVVSPSFWQPGT